MPAFNKFPPNNTRHCFFFACIYKQTEINLGKPHRSSSEMWKDSVFQSEKLNKKQDSSKTLLLLSIDFKRKRISTIIIHRKTSKRQELWISLALIQIKHGIQTQFERFFQFQIIKPASSAFLDAKSLSLNLVPCCWSTSSTTEATEIENIPSDAISLRNHKEKPFWRWIRSRFLPLKDRSRDSEAENFDRDLSEWEDQKEKEEEEEREREGKKRKEARVLEKWSVASFSFFFWFLHRLLQTSLLRHEAFLVWKKSLFSASF